MGVAVVCTTRVLVGVASLTSGVASVDSVAVLTGVPAALTGVAAATGIDSGVAVSACAIAGELIVESGNCKYKTAKHSNPANTITVTIVRTVIMSFC